MLFCYEGNSLKSGIYEIRNRLTGRSYIGQTGEFKERWNYGYKLNLIRNRCHNQFLQNDFNKCVKRFGYEIEDLINFDKEILSEITNFLEFHILEVLNEGTKKKRKSREKYWMKLYTQNGYYLYNFIQEKNGKYSYSAESKQKMSASQKGKHQLTIYNNIELLSPDGTLYTKIEGIYGFAQKHDLNESHLVEVLKGKRKTHKGWRLKENECYSLEKTYDVKLISPKGKIYGPITNLRKFAIKHNLEPSNLYALINEKIYSHLGWKLPKHKNKTRFKTYDVKLISPDNKIYGPIVNVMEFCQKHDIKYECILDVINRRSKTHKKWRLLENINYTPKRVYNIVLLSPTNIEYLLIENLTKFAKINGLSRKYLRHLVNGKIKQYKGWKVKV